MFFLGGSGYQQNPYPQQGNPYQGSSLPAGYPAGQQPPPPTGQSNLEKSHKKKLKFKLSFIQVLKILIKHNKVNTSSII